MPKVEGRVEEWWFSCNLFMGAHPDLCGNFYGLSSIGLEEGKFNDITDVIRIDFVNQVAETERAYIKLGEAADIERILSEITDGVREPDKTGRRK